MSGLDKLKNDLKNAGIQADHMFYNLDYEQLFKHETDPSNEGLEKAILTTLDAVTVDTGKFTGRSPKDKYIVRDETTEKTIWWKTEGNGSDNKPVSKETWNNLKAHTTKQLDGKKLYVMDVFAGANKKSRLAVRVVTEIAWAAHFTKNMFIEATKDELENFKPDWTIYHACKTVYHDHEKEGMRSSVYICFNLTKKETVVGGTWYGGEIKKGIFSMLNYFLPLHGIGAFHCSANQGKNGDTALFFGLSGTGKTTLSTDPHRLLIGDDEHGWDDDGVFNFEGGCYAKTIYLDPESEPEIYKAIKRNALLENVDLRSDNSVDFDSPRKTQNTRVSYPINHIENIVRPVSQGGHPNNIIFLAADAFGVLPPVAKLTSDQAKYYYLSGYTARVAGTELGVTEPQATFSPCFGGPFLTLDPTIYGKILGEKMQQHGSSAWLVNTGWSGGSYGEGKRMSLKITRAIIDVILDGSLENAEYENMPVFNFAIPKKIAGVDPVVLNPRNTWADTEEFDETIINVAHMFIKNFKKYSVNQDGRQIEKAGPVI
jgi:phosphoenolpyruvate carboxykinase (ATP)